MGALLLDEQTAPGTPSTGQVVMYPKADGFLYSKDDVGTETQLAVGLTLATPQATTSGTAFDFTSIPSGTKRITINFVGVSLSGTDHIWVQIGDSGGIEDTSYVASSGVVIHGSSPAVVSSTSAFVMGVGTGTHTVSGTMTLTLEDSSTFTWVSAHAAKLTTTVTITGGGNKSLSAELDKVRITRSGSDTFDAGAVNITYE